MCLRARAALVADDFSFCTQNSSVSIDLSGSVLGCLFVSWVAGGENNRPPCCDWIFAIVISEEVLHKRRRVLSMSSRFRTTNLHRCISQAAYTMELSPSVSGSLLARAPLLNSVPVLSLLCVRPSTVILRVSQIFASTRMVAHL